MGNWRCPHCGTPQAEASRCWVCARSSTICLTCRHFRRGVARDIAYCGLDPMRRPIRGEDTRPCWVEPETRMLVGGLFDAEARSGAR